MDRILRDAQRLYDEGKWPEAVKLIGDNVSHLTSEEEMAEAARIRGWSFYCMGIKGLEEKKLEMLGFSRGMFELALGTTTDNKKKISILNGLPLSLWILGEQEEAWKVSDRAIAEFPDEPSVWNTRSILFRWAKDFKGSAEVCEIIRLWIEAIYGQPATQSRTELMP